MERLTERFDNGQAAVKGCGENCKYDYRYCRNHYEDCPEINGIYDKLAEYEDTDLTPEQIRELAERDKAKAPVDTDDEFDMYVCPSCDMAIGTIGDKRAHNFCLNCGQRLKWEEEEG